MRNSNSSVTARQPLGNVQAMIRQEPLTTRQWFNGKWNVTTRQQHDNLATRQQPKQARPGRVDTANCQLSTVNTPPVPAIRAHRRV